MQTSRSSDVPPPRNSPRGGAHRRPVSHDRWWTLAAVLAVVATGTGLAAAEVSSQQPQQQRPVADQGNAMTSLPIGELKADADAEATTQAEPRGGSKSSQSPADEESSRPSTEESEVAETPVDEIAELRDRAVEIVNSERVAAGCQAVELNDDLTTSADDHSRDMADNGYFDHDSRDGSTFSDRAAEAGYTAAIGENIAYGQSSAESVMESWMDSEGHRDNILNCDAKALGMGVAEADDGTIYWTQVFGSQ